MKGEIGVEVSALLAFSAIKNNDRVGLLIFTDEVEVFVPPKKGRKHVLRVLRELLYFQPQGRKTSIAGALEYLSRVLHRRSVIFVISDFLDQDYEPALRHLSQRHDLIAVVVSDPREWDLPMLVLSTCKTPRPANRCSSIAAMRACARFCRRTAGRGRRAAALYCTKRASTKSRLICRALMSNPSFTFSRADAATLRRKYGD